MKKAMVFGTFDLLHKGHIDFLRQAKEHCNILYIVVAQDENVKKVKGRFPVNQIEKRIAQIKKQIPNLLEKGIESGIELIKGNMTDYFSAIEEKKPDIICLGYDQNSLGLEDEIKRKQWKIKVYRLKPFYENVNKTALIREKNGI